MFAPANKEILQYTTETGYLKIAGLVSDSITDGPGFRYTVFVQGCPHHCFECQNAHTWDFEGGRVMSIDEIFAKIKKNPLIKGVTFSGGEPFCQAKELSALARTVKGNGYELAIYTGYLFEELVESDNAHVRELVRLADTVIDGPFIRAQRDLLLKFKGSHNQRIINVAASLEAGEVVLETGERWT